MNDLLSIRDAWYEAYFSGDVDVLKNHESEGFTFISCDGIEKSENRYELLLEKVESGGWFKPGAKKQDSVIEVKEFGGVCAFIAGRSETYINDKGLGEVSFSEVWIKNNGDWKVESLHIS